MAVLKERRDQLVEQGKIAEPKPTATNNASSSILVGSDDERSHAAKLKAKAFIEAARTPQEAQ